MHVTFSGIINAARIAGTIVLLQAWRKGDSPLFRTPGHWLVGVTTLTSVAWLLIWAFFVFVSPNNYTYSMTYGIPIAAVESGAYYFASRTFSKSPWKGFFLAFSLSQLFEMLIRLTMVPGIFIFAIYSFWSKVQLLIQFLLCVWLFVVVIRDRKRAVFHDWIH